MFGVRLWTFVGSEQTDHAWLPGADEPDSALSCLAYALTTKALALTTWDLFFRKTGLDPPDSRVIMMSPALAFSGTVTFGRGLLHPVALSDLIQQSLLLSTAKHPAAILERRGTMHSGAR